jgi:molecular chaperone HtpG
MVQGQLKIHSENILPIIKKWLYSEKDIFVRELVSNSCDAIQKVKILSDLGDIQSKAQPRIDVTIDKQAMTLTFSDTGIGMDAEEVEKYLAQIAFSGAEEFIKSYQAKDPFIGHFGLGFYSAYMVADKVEVHTLSCKDGAKPVIWQCDGSSTYDLIEGSRQTHGTDITLFIGKDNVEYLEDDRLQKILMRYCAFLPYPIYFNGTCINENEPLWLKTPAECSKNDYLGLFRKLYPFEPAPLFWVHLNVDYPFHVKGVLFFPQMGKDFDYQKSQVKLFCNRVFVSDDCKDVLPEYLTMLRGVIDSPDIPLNVSRSYLQVDKTVRAASQHIAKKVADALISLHKQESARFFEIYKDVEFIVKLGILQDEKFYAKAKDVLFWKTTQNNFTTLENYLEKAPNKETIFYTTLDQINPELIKLYEEKGYEIIISSGPIDSPLFAYLEKELKTVHFKRIDAEVHNHLLDPSKEKTVLDTDGKTEAAKIADFVREALGDENLEVSAKSLSSTEIPGLLVMQEEERRFRDYLTRMSKDPVSQALKKMTFVLNTNSSLITSIYQVREKKADLAKEMIREVYDLTLLSQNEMDNKQVQEFIVRSNKLIEQLAKQLCGT